MPTQEVGSMLDSPTIEKLKEMKLQAMAEMLSDPESSSINLCFEDLPLWLKNNGFSNEIQRLQDF